MIPSGVIGTLAGNGEPGHSGDGGPAMQAALHEPKCVVHHERGRLYIADAENHLIRMVELSTGRMGTVAGCRAVPDAVTIPVEPPSRREDPAVGDPLWESIGAEKFAQLSDLSGTVRFVTGSGPGKGRFAGDGGQALEASLNFPSSVVVDSDQNLYIADTMNHRIRKVDGKTGIMTTIVGTGKARYSGDEGLALTAALNEPVALAIDGGFLYIADQSNNRVRRLDLATGRISTMAGTGDAGYSGDGIPAITAALASPSGLAIRDETLYIADTFNGRIRAVDLLTGVIRTVAGDGGEYRYQAANDFSTSLSRPYGIALDLQDNILITDSDNHLIRRWDKRRKIITTVAGNGVAQFTGDGGPALGGSLNYPFGVAVDGEGNIYVADTFNHRIRMIGA
jgi:DNA-binding beta-propeller fold protein YncE